MTRFVIVEKDPTAQNTRGIQGIQRIVDYNGATPFRGI